MGPEPQGRDKRKHDRIRLTSSKKIWNLSEGGAYIATTSPRRVGSILHFEYTFDNRHYTFKALAKVIRVLHKPNPKLGEPAGMALQFLEVSKEDHEQLSDYLEGLQQNRGD